MVTGPSSGRQARDLCCTGGVAPWRVGSSQTKDPACVSCTGRRVFFTPELPGKPSFQLLTVHTIRVLQLEGAWKTRCCSSVSSWATRMEVWISSLLAWPRPLAPPVCAKKHGKLFVSLILCLFLWASRHFGSKQRYAYSHRYIVAVDAGVCIN